MLRCVIHVYPCINLRHDDDVLRTSVVHELAHCLGIRSEEQTDRIALTANALNPEVFGDYTVMHTPEYFYPYRDVLKSYLISLKIPVVDIPTEIAILNRAAVDLEYSARFFSRASIVRLRPGVFYRARV